MSRTRRCSQCSNNGHNSRTCPSTRSRSTVKLFGVRLLTDGSGPSIIMKKSASMGSLISSSSSSSSAVSPNRSSSDGYVSNEPSTSPNSHNNHPLPRNKGVPWTEEEHRLFLIGLQRLGKGDWRGIARNFVVSKTPTQVASHAQKYFIRQSSATRRRRRSSLFDMVPDMASNPPSVPEEQVLLPPCENSKPSNAESLPSLNLSLRSEFEPMGTTSQENVEEPNETITGSHAATPVPPGFFPTYLPLPFSVWPSSAASFEEVNGTETSHHQVLKPIPVIPKEPVNVDELVGMSQLNIDEMQVCDREPSLVDLNLLGEPARQSAFHANTPVGDSDLNNCKKQCDSSNLIFSNLVKNAVFEPSFGH